MTPLSAELIAAPAALMVLLAMVWFRRHRSTRVATVHDVSEDGFDDRLKRFMSSGRRGSGKDQPVVDDVATTGIIPVAAIETAATDVPAPVLEHAAAAPEDAVFGPSSGTADEPDWHAMRLPHAPEPQELAHETAPEITTAPASPTPAAAEGELITRPGWPLPGDLEAWESADFAPSAPEPSLGHWAEVAAARTEEPIGTDDLHQRGSDAGSEAIVLGAPYPAPAMAPPASFAGAMEPPAGSPAEPPLPVFGDGVDAIGQPATPANPSTDPSFWEVGPSVTPAPERVEPATAETTEEWPPKAAAQGASPWGADAPPVGTESEAHAEPEPHAASNPGGAIGPDEWWAADAASLAPEPTAVPDARSLPSSESAGPKRPARTSGAALNADWWEAAPGAQPSPPAEDWWTTPASPSPYADPNAPAPEAPDAASPQPVLVGATAVATGAAGSAGARVLPRLDVAAQNQQTAGRFAVGGSAVAPGDGAFTRVRFRTPLNRPILGWAIGDGPHHAPGTLVLMVDAVLNCSTSGLSVLQEDTDPMRPDGFTLSLSSDGPGPFAVSGNYYVVTG